MHLRAWLNNNPSVVLIGSVTLLVACLGLIVLQLAGPQQAAPSRLWLDPASMTLIEPDRPDPTALRPVFFACGSAAELEAAAEPGVAVASLEQPGRSLIYVERMTADAPLERAFVTQGVIGAFVPPDSEQGVAWERELEQRLRALCPHGDWVECRPVADR
ncbi:MAG: hypothetical protein AAF288_08950 [Planctomycetota bacterium]